MQITIYSKNHCVQCDRTKKLFDSENIKFNEVNLDTNAEDMDKIINLGFQSAPVVVVKYNDISSNASDSQNNYFSIDDFNKSDDANDDSSDAWCGFRLDKIKKVIELSKQNSAHNISDSVLVSA